MSERPESGLKGRAWPGFEKELAARIAELDSIIDPLGKGIDEGIKEAVALVNMLGYPTYGSCEGHSDWGTPTPWLYMGAPEKPRFRFSGEASAHKRILKEVGATEVDYRVGDDLWDAYYERLTRWQDETNLQETRRYARWRKDNTAMIVRFRGWLDDFEKEKPPHKPQSITLHPTEGGFRIEVSDVFLESDEEIMDEVIDGKREAPDDLKNRLSERQAYMRAFSDFLKKKLKEEGAGMEKA